MYWKPVWDVLEAFDLELLLANRVSVLLIKTLFHWSDLYEEKIDYCNSNAELIYLATSSICIYYQ
ncbi:hypothetical protein PUR_32050 [Paenibacillus sp. URB8-2]|nr:hypothetical protein PUR_32050 [Paenibacillus sp. URB8-2]